MGRTTPSLLSVRAPWLGHEWRILWDRNANRLIQVADNCHHNHRGRYNYLRPVVYHQMLLLRPVVLLPVLLLPQVLRQLLRNV